MTQQERDEDIVQLLRQPYENLVTVGKKYGLTRERIRQIYKKVTGNPYTELKPVKQGEIRQRSIDKRNAVLDSVRFTCQVCGKPVLVRDHGSKYCKACRREYRETSVRFSQLLTCSGCGKSYYAKGLALYNLRSGKTKHSYCSRECFFKNRKMVWKDYTEKIRRETLKGFVEFIWKHDQEGVAYDERIEEYLSSMKHETL